MALINEVWYSSGSNCRHELPRATVYDRPVAKDSDLSLIAERCAEDFHSNHDGWECSWPREFVLWGSEEGGEELGRFEIDRETVPVFSAVQIKRVTP